MLLDADLEFSGYSKVLQLTASCLSTAKLSAGVGICRPQLSSCSCFPLAESLGARNEELGVKRKANTAEYAVPWWLFGKERVVVGGHRAKQGAMLPGAQGMAAP